MRATRRDAKRNSVSRSRLRVVVDSAIKGTNVPGARTIGHWVRSALPERARGEIVVRIVDEAESAKLNRRYRGRHGATNVLAFVPDAAAARLDPNPPLGDLVICGVVVEAEAREQGKPPKAHWAHIAVHGALHLIGYDHDTDRAARRMERKEREILAILGMADPYRPAVRRPRKRSPASDERSRRGSLRAPE